MNYCRYMASTLILLAPVLIPHNFSLAQESIPNTQQSDSELEMFSKAKQDLWRLNESDRQDFESARKVEVQLWSILKRYPNSAIHEQVEEALIQAQEILAGRCLKIAYMHFDRGKLTNLDMQGAEFWLIKTIYESPKFTRRDEALLALAKLYLTWGRNEDATKHLRKLVCNYPASNYASEASEQLNKMGAGGSEDCGKLKPE